MAGGSFGGGDGTSGSPWLVEDADDLNAIRNHTVSYYYKQTADIEVSGDYPSWTPIATSGAGDYFLGYYDGDSYDIQNLTDSLFKYAYANRASIFVNIKIIDTDISNTTNYCGGLLQILQYNSVGDFIVADNVVVRGTIANTATYTGGIFGYVSCPALNDNFKTRIHRCSNYADVTGVTYVGGIVGIFAGATGSKNEFVYLEDCKNTGNVVGDAYVGGIYGYNSMVGNSFLSKFCRLNVTRVINEGVVKGVNFVGGINGYDNTDPGSLTTLVDCYSLGYLIERLSGSGTTFQRVGYGDNITDNNNGLDDMIYRRNGELDTTFTAGGVQGADITAANAKKQATYPVEFVFSSTYWAIVEDSSYPYLAYAPASPTLLAPAVPFKAVGAKINPPLPAWTTSEPTEFFIEVLDHIGTRTAEAGTTTGNITITGHGLVPLDAIVNEDTRTVDAERGSRLVYDVGWDVDNIPINTVMTEQLVGDDIRLYKFNDITGLLCPGTFKLNRKGRGQSTLNFDMITDADRLLVHGQYVRVYGLKEAVQTFVFYGQINSHSEELLGPNQTAVKQNIGCESLIAVANRRTIEISEAAGTTYGSIVEKMVDDYLFQDLIRKGNIETGASLVDDWEADTISIKDVLDECASKSAFEWYVSDSGLLVFQDPQTSIPSATTPVVNGSFKSYFNFKVATSSTEYYNKIFLEGGSDENGNPIEVNYEDFDESTAQQEITGGTGVYGLIKRDSTLIDAPYTTVEAGSTTTIINSTAHGQVVGDMVWNYTRDEKRVVLTVPTANQFTVAAFSALNTPSSATAEAGTDTTNIKITTHGVVVNEMIYNSTRDEYRFVLEVVDVDNFTVAAVTSQTSGDTIEYSGDIMVFFNQANDVLQDLRKRQSIDPTEVSFDTPAYFEPMTKMRVDVPAIGQDEQYFLVEDVEVYDIGVGLAQCWYRVKASKRNESIMTTHRKLDYRDYWRDK